MPHVVHLLLALTEYKIPMRQHSNTARLFLKLLSSWFVLLALFATATRSSPRKRVLGLGVLSGNEHPVDLDSFDESDSSIVKENGKYRIRQISILGERHSGTNWIAKHLQNCFGDAVYVSMRSTTKMINILNNTSHLYSYSWL